jgi:hypothetical protein
VARESNHPGGPKLDVDFEIEQYIHALGESSSRVRFVMLAIIISSVAAAATLWSERTNAWARDRLTTEAENSSIANECHLWNRFSEGADCAKDLKEQGLLHQEHLGPGPTEAKQDIIAEYGFDPVTCFKVCDADDWLSRYGINSRKRADLFAEKQQEAYINNVLYVRTPVLGLTFDINDLGIITGVTFCLLMLVMVFYTHRAHENLVLAMWKVQEIAEEDQAFDVPGSRANLLYHSLAMEQVFTVPPTLARWNDFQSFRRAHYLLFVVPLLVQLLVFLNDLKSAEIGAAFSSSQTQISEIVQFFLILVVIPLCILCGSHLHADDTLWDQVFLLINPAHRFKGKANWLHWVRVLRLRHPSWGIVGRKEGGVTQLYVSDSVQNVVWKFDTKELRIYKHLKSHLHGHGLFLAKDNSVHSYSRSQRSLRRFEACMADHEILYWPRSGAAGTMARFEVIGNLGETYELELSRRAITLLSTSFYQKEIRIGGGRFQADGPKDVAGFASIHAFLPYEDFLLVTDGSWLRKVEMSGDVSTWGGKPLGQAVRRERPFLLGMAAVDGKPITFQSTPKDAHEAFSPTVLVCDFSLRRVLGVQENAVKEAYRSDPSWSPSGIWFDDSDIYLLEYRAYPVPTEEYLRILKFTELSFRRRPTVLLSLPRGDGWADFQ